MRRGATGPHSVPASFSSLFNQFTFLNWLLLTLHSLSLLSPFPSLTTDYYNKETTNTSGLRVTATELDDELMLIAEAPALDTVAPVDFTTHTIINLNTNTITNTDTDTEIESEGEDGKDGEAILEIEYGKPSEFKYVGRDGQPSDVFKPSNNESGGMDDENEGQGEGRSQPLALSDGYYWRCEDKGSLIYREQKGRVVDWGLAWVPEVDGPELSQREKRVRFSGSLDKITTEYEVISVSKFW